MDNAVELQALADKAKRIVFFGGAGVSTASGIPDFTGEDGLHRQAGNRLVYELHGSVHENRCIECGRFYGLSYILNTQGVPKCESCGRVVKPSVVLYGEGLDHYVTTGACREISRCDLLIVAGTSLTVEPAASMLSYFRGGSRKMVIINREETQADERASLVIRGDVEKVLGALEVSI